MIRFGTCSWKYESWRGILYGGNTPKPLFLQEYAQHYNSVEIDQWFWSLFGDDKVVLPQIHVVQEYADAVPDDFKFTIKVPNSITLTNYYKSVKNFANQPNPYFLSLKLFEEFLQTLKPIYPKIGMLMFQFEYLNKQKMPSQRIFEDKMGTFLEQIPAGFPYGIEIRNPNYLNKNYFSFLNERKVSHVFLQGYYMPDITGVCNNFQTQITKTPVLRLHGGDRKEIEEKSRGKWDKIVEPKDNELSRIAKIIADLDDKNLEVYVNVNNHYEGSSPRTIEKLKEYLKNN